MTLPEAGGTNERLAVIGCGLIGTSIAMAGIRLGNDVRGFDTDAAVLDNATARGGFRASQSPEEAMDGASIVFVCVPGESIPQVVADALAAASEAIVTDAGSVKSAIVAQVDVEASPVDVERFVGGHPMGGSERSGPEGASASLIDGIVWALTPTERTNGDAVGRLEDWIRRAGARPMRMNPAGHDRAVAIVSHLPQVASSTLMALAAREEAGDEEVLLLAAGGFRDLTRLAASNPALWTDIMESNRGEIARAIDLYVEDLVKLRNLLASGEVGRDAVEVSLTEAKRARLAMAAKASVKAGVGVLQIPVPDRPGVLAELTAAMGESDVNIEDLQIVHSLEGAKGTVHLTVAAADASSAEKALADHGFDSVRLA